MRTVAATLGGSVPEPVSHPFLWVCTAADYHVQDVFGSFAPAAQGFGGFNDPPFDADYGAMPSLDNGPSNFEGDVGLSTSDANLGDIHNLQFPPRTLSASSPTPPTPPAVNPPLYLTPAASATSLTPTFGDAPFLSTPPTLSPQSGLGSITQFTAVPAAYSAQTALPLVNMSIDPVRPAGTKHILLTRQHPRVIKFVTGTYDRIWNSMFYINAFPANAQDTAKAALVAVVQPDPALADVYVRMQQDASYLPALAPLVRIWSSVESQITS